MKKLFTPILLMLAIILLSSCASNRYQCSTYKVMNKPKISTAQYFPIKQRTDVFGNKVYRAWDLNLKTKTTRK